MRSDVWILTGPVGSASTDGLTRPNVRRTAKIAAYRRPASHNVATEPTGANNDADTHVKIQARIYRAGSSSGPSFDIRTEGTNPFHVKQNDGAGTYWVHIV